MKQINIEVRNKRAKLTNPDEYLVCGNNDYELVFGFDEEWAEYPAKTALFVFADKSVPVVFEGNICKGVAIEGATECAIGVFAGDIKTTTGAFICCVASIRDIGKTPKAPEPDVYNQIMELLQKAIQAHTELPIGGKAGQILKKKSNKDYDTEWADDENGISEEDVNRKIESSLTTGREDIVKYSTEEPDYSVIGAINASLINIDSIYGYISDIENEINGVEEELQMLNEGGIQ